MKTMPHYLVARLLSGYSGEVYRNLSVSIDRHEKLYQSWGGKYSFDEINRYLGFFDDLGFYHESGFLKLKMINQGFGYAIIEALEYPEIQRYINDIRENANEKRAFVSFEFLAKKLEDMPQNESFTRSIQKAYQGIE